MIRGFQLAEHMSALGYDASVVNIGSSAVAGINNSIVVFVKHLDSSALETAIANRNIVIWNLSDRATWGRNFTSGSHLDGVVFPTRRALQDFSGSFRSDAKKIVIWESADIRWQPAAPWRYRLGYLGSRFSLDDRYLGIRGLHCLYSPMTGVGPEIEAFFRKAKRYACHFSVRLEETADYLYKPNAKLVGAAASGVNIILSRDATNLEILDTDYPYFTDSDIDSVKEMVRFARATYRKKEWKAGLDMMRDVREKTSRERVTRNYIDYFQSFD